MTRFFHMSEYSGPVLVSANIRHASGWKFNLQGFGSAWRFPEVVLVGS